MPNATSPNAINYAKLNYAICDCAKYVNNKVNNEGFKGFKGFEGF